MGTVQGIRDWMWVPNKNMIVYNAFFPNEDETAPKVDPKIGFMKIPDRRVIDQKLMKNSENLTMVMHPQGFYLGVINYYRTKKTKQYSVEVFDLTTNSESIAQQ